MLSSLRGWAGGARRICLSLSVLALVPALLPTGLACQEPLTLPELERTYRAAVAAYQDAYETLRVLQSQFERASDTLRAAQLAGNQARRDSAFAVIMQLSPERTLQEQRVEEKADELTEVRERLLDALNLRLDDYLDRTTRVLTDLERRELAVQMADTRNRINELRAEEDPEVTLEPLPDIQIELRDSPDDIRAKATLLEVRADQAAQQLAEIDRRLETLRAEQSRLRRANDFMAGVERFDDPRLPVGPPGGQRTPPPDQARIPAGADSTAVGVRPLTREEEIEALSRLREVYVETIQATRDKAVRFRREAGGDERA